MSYGGGTVVGDSRDPFVISVKRVRSRSSHRSKETLRPSKPSSNCPVQNRASSLPRDDGSSIATASIQQASALRRTAVRPAEISSAASGPMASHTSSRAWRKLPRESSSLVCSHSIRASRSLDNFIPGARQRYPRSARPFLLRGRMSSPRYEVARIGPSRWIRAMRHARGR